MFVFVQTVSPWKISMNPFISAMLDCKWNIENIEIQEYPKSACGITENYKIIWGITGKRQ